uniref:Uncharacterized protein n=1 Tax=Aplanochytrium stocchinoi TaxID=215587 RepID=A0A7S3V0P6_9STRA
MFTFQQAGFVIIFFVLPNTVSVVTIHQIRLWEKKIETYRAKRMPENVLIRVSSINFKLKQTYITFLQSVSGTECLSNHDHGEVIHMVASISTSFYFTTY